ncbi:MAG TPA: hypothetical protein PKA27_10670 [Fimbriimonadaceae bacterium]|nr:hypothetical protein [Fimbriimonadaceae bacterium]
MPHIHLETTTNVSENGDIAQILLNLVEALSACPTIDSKSVKAYHTLRPVWVIGEGGPQGFVHCTVMILTGRDEDLRKQIQSAIVKVLQEGFAESLGSREAGLTVEIREMDRVTYFK